MERKITQRIRGFRTIDGAGVNLVRVLGSRTVQEFDPILLLDSFDSTNPDDYTSGFPMHPHRGIETISYLYRGQMTHRDSLGNEDTIGDGEIQWMTAGSGILHEERLPASERLLGLQLWLNLPARDKMVHPAYLHIRNNEIPEIELKNGRLRLLAGEFEGNKGHRGGYLPLDYYDVQLEPQASVSINTGRERSVILFTLSGDANIGGEPVIEKTAVKLSAGDHVKIESREKKAHILFISSTPLKEPVAWGGPIVMNTREELDRAFDDLDKGSFLRHSIDY
jgi:redox-sensitive bicupin YhaK (pirin superfamily)